MKTLIFEGAGWEIAESAIVSGVGNCRIRTRIRNCDGRLIYLEMGCNMYSSEKKTPEFAKGFKVMGYVSHCFYADSEWDSSRSHSTNLYNYELSHYFEFSPESIIKWVNEELNCSFDELKVINDNSVRVHDTKEALCDCSEKGYIPYIDPEYNISLLGDIKPIRIDWKSRVGLYSLSYDFMYKQFPKWLTSALESEKRDISKFKYYVSFRWNVNGNIISAEVSAYENFGLRGVGLELVEPLINEIIN
ncbi:hypothetical protein BSK59_13095 [Paenibacillus odorifer]|uniref:hypothetical protein n=1 Tax=Paenibacillus odorifer TaxID=189426 RepID=UPI00096D0BED|nr:hypothetical protein [Paenibacillus odorifer]OME55409.1 hypothetical protein BSK59_13095 [Paenibacillus odorifer]